MLSETFLRKAFRPLDGQKINQLALAASKFESQIQILTSTTSIDIKSIMGLFQINGLPETFTLQISGTDEDAARKEMTRLLAELIHAAPKGE